MFCFGETLFLDPTFRISKMLVKPPPNANTLLFHSRIVVRRQSGIVVDGVGLVA